MGRKAGSLLRATCRKCGVVELRRGCNASYVCDSCSPTTGNPYYRAHAAVANAVKSGELPPARECKCVDCGGPATEYDHRDYFKPLDVEPVCHACNLRRGPAIGSRANPFPPSLTPASHVGAGAFSCVKELRRHACSLFRSPVF